MNIWYDSGLGTVLFFLLILGLYKLLDYREKGKSSDDQQSPEPELRKISNTYILS